MAYKEIPNPTDKISESQAEIKENFVQLKQFLELQHVDFASADKGKHKYLTLQNQTSSPSTAVNECAIFVKTNSKIPPEPSLFVRKHDNGDEYDITTADLTNPGWCRLPCGLIMKWGYQGGIAYGGNGLINIAHGTGIPSITTLLSINVSLHGSITNQSCSLFFNSWDDTSTHKVTVSIHRISGSSGTAGVYYLAIGV